MSTGARARSASGQPTVSSIIPPPRCKTSSSAERDRGGDRERRERIGGAEASPVAPALSSSLCSLPLNAIAARLRIDPCLRIAAGSLVDRLIVGAGKSAAAASGSPTGAAADLVIDPKPSAAHRARSGSLRSMKSVWIDAEREHATAGTSRAIMTRRRRFE
jgi:hypothetical protein